MKLNLIETVPTGGALNEEIYRIQRFYPVFQMQKELDTNCLLLDDFNYDQPSLPVPVGDVVKKVVLTYNGIDYQSNQVFETMVYDSKAAFATDSQTAGYANSNMWRYCPNGFKECVETTWDPVCGEKVIPSDNPPGVSIPSKWPENTCESPYNWSHGIVVKKFLVGDAHLTNEYYVRYSAPEWYDVYPSNVRGGLVYTDGWYSGYYFNIFKYGAASLPAYVVGLIVWYDNAFWKSVTGTGSVPSDSNPDWKKVSSLQDWVDFMVFLQNSTINDLGFFLMNQYLVTCELNDAILNEVMVMPNLTPLDFGTNCISQWVKLTQKKAGAVANFYNENFKESQRIIEQTRDLRTPRENLGFRQINTVIRGL